MITFRSLKELLKSKSMSLYKLKSDKVIGTATLDKIRKEEGDVSTKSINSICKYLKCQPGDIMEYVPDSDDE